MRFFYKDSLNFLNRINVLVEFIGRGELIRIDYIIILRYIFIIDVRFVDRICILDFLIKLRLFFW